MREWISGLSEMDLAFLLAVVMMAVLLTVGGLLEGRRARLAAVREERKRMGLPPEGEGR